MSKNINSMMLKRQSAEKRFRFYGQASLAIALIMLVAVSYTHLRAHET